MVVLAEKWTANAEAKPYASNVMIDTHDQPKPVSYTKTENEKSNAGEYMLI